MCHTSHKKSLAPDAAKAEAEARSSAPVPAPAAPNVAANVPMTGLPVATPVTREVAAASAAPVEGKTSSVRKFIFNQLDGFRKTLPPIKGTTPEDNEVEVSCDALSL